MPKSCDPGQDSGMAASLSADGLQMHGARDANASAVASREASSWPRMMISQTRKKVVRRNSSPLEPFGQVEHRLSVRHSHQAGQRKPRDPQFVPVNTLVSRRATQSVCRGDWICKKATSRSTSSATTVATSRLDFCTFRDLVNPGI